MGNEKYRPKNIAAGTRRVPDFRTRRARAALNGSGMGEAPKRANTFFEPIALTLTLSRRERGPWAHASRNALRSLAAAFVAICAAIVAWPPAAGAAERPVWELRPYRVQVLVAIAVRPELAGQSPAALAGRLAERVRALQSRAWRLPPRRPP